MAPKARPSVRGAAIRSETRSDHEDPKPRRFLGHGDGAVEYENHRRIGEDRAKIIKAYLSWREAAAKPSLPRFIDAWHDGRIDVDRRLLLAYKTLTRSRLIVWMGKSPTGDPELLTPRWRGRPR